MNIALARGQAWKPVLFGGASPAREIFAVEDDIVTYRTVGTGDHRDHKLNRYDFVAWIVYWQAYQTEITQ